MNLRQNKTQSEQNLEKMKTNRVGFKMVEDLNQLTTLLNTYINCFQLKTVLL